MNNGTIESRVPYEDYAKIDALSITRLKHMATSPKHYRYALTSTETTDALQLGIAAHTATLEPERYARQFAVWSRRGPSGNLCPRNGQYWDMFLAQHAGKDPDRDVITEDQHLTALDIAKAVRSDPLAAQYLAAGDPEVSLQWETWVEASMGRARSVKCRGRVDWLTSVGSKPCLVGLKSARDIRPALAGNQAHKLGYHMQWAYYHDAYLEIKGAVPLMREIYVENKAPFDVAVYEIPEEVIQQGREDYMRLLTRWVECSHDQVWPGIAAGSQLVMSLPTYAYPGEGDLSDLDIED